MGGKLSKHGSDMDIEKGLALYPCSLSFPEQAKENVYAGVAVGYEECSCVDIIISSTLVPFPAHQEKKCCVCVYAPWKSANRISAPLLLHPLRDNVPNS